MTATETHEALFAAFDAAGIGSIAAGRTLLTLDRRGEISMGDAAKAIGASTAAMTHTTDRLELLGFLERRRYPLNRRTIFLALTAKGRDLIQRLP